MTLSFAQSIAAAYAHAASEEGTDVEAILATIDPDPVFEFYPIGKRFTGMATTRRYYTNFVNSFGPRMIRHKLLAESVGPEGLVQEFVLTMTHEGDDAPTSHHVMAIVLFGKEGIAGERICSDDKFLRSLLGPVWDEAESIDISTR